MCLCCKKQKGSAIDNGRWVGWGARWGSRGGATIRGICAEAYQEEGSQEQSSVCEFWCQRTQVISSASQRSFYFHVKGVSCVIDLGTLLRFFLFVFIQSYLLGCWYTGLISYDSLNTTVEATNDFYHSDVDSLFVLISLFFLLK